MMKNLRSWVVFFCLTLLFSCSTFNKQKFTNLKALKSEIEVEENFSSDLNIPTIHRQELFFVQRDFFDSSNAKNFNKGIELEDSVAVDETIRNEEFETFHILTQKKSDTNFAIDKNIELEKIPYKNKTKVVEPTKPKREKDGKGFIVAGAIAGLFGLLYLMLAFNIDKNKILGEFLYQLVFITAVMLFGLSLIFLMVGLSNRAEYKSKKKTI